MTILGRTVGRFSHGKERYLAPMNLTISFEPYVAREPTEDELWVDKSPFQMTPVVWCPAWWRLVGPLVCWWKRLETKREWINRFEYSWTFMCPRCSYDCDWVLEEPENWNAPNSWYKTTNGGRYFTGEYTCHWFEGIVTCPRCMSEWEYGDSN